MQKRVIRTIANVRSFVHTAPLYRSLGILKVSDIYLLECYKFIHNELQTNTLFSFTQTSNIHTINTRNRSNIRPTFPKLEAQKRFVTYFGCLKWNNLPDSFKQIDNSTTFKIKTKKYILDSYNN